MKHYFVIIIALYSPFLLFGQTPATTNILIRFQDKVDVYDFVDTYQSLSKNKVQFTIKRQISKLLNLYSIEYNGRLAEGDWLINDLQKSKHVLSIGYDTPLTYRNTTPNDEHYWC